MNIETATKQLEALGNLTRLEIYRKLVEAGPEGVAVGEPPVAAVVVGCVLDLHRPLDDDVDLPPHLSYGIALPTANRTHTESISISTPARAIFAGHTPTQTPEQIALASSLEWR